MGCWLIDSLGELYSGLETMATNNTLVVNRIWDERVVVCWLVVVLVAAKVAVRVAIETAVGRLISISLISIVVNNMGCTQSPCDKRQHLRYKYKISIHSCFFPGLWIVFLPIKC